MANYLFHTRFETFFVSFALVIYISKPFSGTVEKLVSKPIQYVMVMQVFSTVENMDLHMHCLPYDPVESTSAETIEQFLWVLSHLPLILSTKLSVK